ncbi:hypothetical protein [Leuconostoc litchii]|uniref:Uncharacterized protein n=1 Tax=Leuconostoc litchii TaxID=1981069 RepID=A0A6P2CNU8_9LACO|nr:hypothetical protein [Leuconostoc litchii]TYC47053.1 hypothetical protein ESZ47_02670 [Leuconostoc litchii]
MKKVASMFLVLLVLCFGITYFIKDSKINENVQKKSKAWTEKDYKELIAGESLDSNKPYTSNQVSMYLNIVHEHGKPDSKSREKKGNITETTAIWINLINHSNGKIKLIFEGERDENLLLSKKTSTVW